MRVSSLRWLFLLAAAIGGASCVFRDATPTRYGLSVVCGLLWFWMSRRKIRSLDRETLGLPPRER